MKEVFVKKYWDEGSILYFLHFKDGEAIRQIEISNDNSMYLDISNPLHFELIYDQKLEELDLEEKDFITKEDFNKAWEGGNK